MILVLYWVYDLRAKTQKMLAELDPRTPVTTQQVQESFDNAQYNLGFGLGFILASGLSTGASLATTGLVMVLARPRTDQLLLQYWDGETAAT